MTSVENQIFAVVETMPTFGEELQDLEDYLNESLCICGMDDIVAGEIIVTAIIQKDGTACLNRYKGSNVFKKSVDGLIAFFEDMPKWNPGKQRGEEVVVFRNFTILIDKGGILIK